MQFERTLRQPPVINLSALIDITFILVIFIVLAANFHRINQMDVNLPDAQVSGKVDPSALVITVPAAGPVEVLGQPVEPADLQAFLAERKGQFDSVMLVADQQASIQRAVKILSDAQASGFSNVGIATERPAP